MRNLKPEDTPKNARDQRLEETVVTSSTEKPPTIATPGSPKISSEKIAQIIARTRDAAPPVQEGTRPPRKISKVAAPLEPGYYWSTFTEIHQKNNPRTGDPYYQAILRIELEGTDHTVPYHMGPEPDDARFQQLLAALIGRPLEPGDDAELGPHIGERLIAEIVQNPRNPALRKAIRVFADPDRPLPNTAWRPMGLPPANQNTPQALPAQPQTNQAAPAPVRRQHPRLPG